MDTNTAWNALKEQLAASLTELEKISKERAVAYLETIEPKLTAIASMTPDEARQATDALLVNARAELYILGIEAETETARIALAGVRMAVGLLRAAVA